MSTRVFHARQLNPKNDLERIQRFMAAAPRYPTLLMRAPLANLSTFKGWWYGALEGGEEVRALACVETASGTAATIHASDNDALREMARSMLREATGRAAHSGKAHQLFGEASTLAVFWEIFKTVNRTLVSDMTRQLLSCAEVQDPGGKVQAQVRPATASDLRVVFEFSADQTLEQWGIDPRRSAREAHERRCQEVIASGRQLIGTERGKPVFIAEINSPSADTAMLDRIFVPRPFRRARVVARAIAGATQHALAHAPEVCVFIDEGNEVQLKAATLAGFEHRCDYRLLMLRS